MGLDVIGFPDFGKDYVSEHRKLSRKVEEYQSKMKAHTDLTREAKTPNFSAGDYMRICLPESQPKGVFGFG